MSIFVQLSDFKTGKLKIPTTQFTTDDLQECIDNVEADILTDLLGCTLYNEFIEDYDTDPANEFSQDRFLAIFEPFCNDEDFCYLRSEGMKKMLKNIIYFEFMRDLQTTKRVTGFQQETSDNSTHVSAKYAGIASIYNKFVDSYHAIQRYICSNPESYDYDDFKGIRKDYLSCL